MYAKVAQYIGDRNNLSEEHLEVCCFTTVILLVKAWAYNMTDMINYRDSRPSRIVPQVCLKLLLYFYELYMRKNPII